MAVKLKNSPQATHTFANKRILITGCCGTVGRELVRQLAQEHVVEELIGLDNNESELFLLQEAYKNHGQTDFLLGDVRDRDKLIRAFRHVDIVFHTAAFKHVLLCERSPFEAVQTNINGVQNVIAAACENKVAKVLFTSSDKAVNPTNVMGTSKLMGERLMTAANVNLREASTALASTRFGNVLGSRGSVIPLFQNQIKHGGPVTLTDPSMTRFIMSIQEAVSLVIDSAELVRGGEVFVTKMPAIRISDLAEVMIEELAPLHGFAPEAVKIVIIGAKPGEKHYEELLSHEETRRTLELERYFAVLPAFKHFYRSINYDYPDIVRDTVSNAYHSANEECLDRTTLREFLLKNDLLTPFQE